MTELTTMTDYVKLLSLFRFNFQSYEISEVKPGTVCICFRGQRLKAWWFRNKLKKFIRSHKPVSICVEIVISLGWV